MAIEAAGVVSDTPVPGEINVDVSRGVETGFSGKPGDFARDMALIQASMAQSGDAAPAESAPRVEAPRTTEAVIEEFAKPSPVPNAPTKPESTQAVETPKPQEPKVDIPPKFQTPDGNLDADKLAKSTVSAQEALEKYRALERELRQTQAKAHQAKQGTPLPASPAPATPVAPESFEAQIEADIKAHGVGPTLAKLFNAANEAAYNRARGDIEGVLQETHLNKTERELQQLGQVDPFILSEEGFNSLSKIRNERPWVNNSVTPWKDAYLIHQGEQSLKQKLGASVLTPTPKAVTAPPVPVTAAPRVQAGPTINLGDPRAIEQAVKAMTPDQEDAFWASRGLPPIHRKGR